MGSGVLLAALVVLWFVVLVPMVVTRGETQGGRAELADSGRTLEYRVVGATEADLSAGRLSVDSPLAQAVLGKSEGDGLVAAVVIECRACSCCGGERPDPGRGPDCRAAARRSTTAPGRRWSRRGDHA